RVDVDDGVLGPRFGFRGVGIAAPEVDHGLALERGAERRADIGAGVEVGGEGVADGGEAVLDGAVNVGHAYLPQANRNRLVGSPGVTVPPRPSISSRLIQFSV